MIVKGPILIPGIPDLSGEVLDEQTIRKSVVNNAIEESINTIYEMI